MTMPANISAEPEELPPPELKLLVTDNLDPTTGQGRNGGPTVNWIVKKDHPFMSSMTIECMFVSRNAVAVYVYSTSKDGQEGSRDVIPMSRVRLAHERMVPEILGEEISDSEEGKDPYVYEDDPEPEPGAAVTEPPPAPTNGQASP